MALPRYHLCALCKTPKPSESIRDTTLKVCDGCLPAPSPSAEELIDGVLARVARAFKIPANELRGTRRNAPIAHARHVAYYLARHVSNASYPAIGRYFARDHSTVIHGCQAVEARAAVHPKYAALLQTMLADLGELQSPAPMEKAA